MVAQYPRADQVPSNRHMCIAANQAALVYFHLLFRQLGGWAETGFNALRMQNCCKTKGSIIAAVCQLTITVWLLQLRFGDVRAGNPYWRCTCNGLSGANTAHSQLGLIAMCVADTHHTSLGLELPVMFALKASYPPAIWCCDTGSRGGQHSAETMRIARAAAANTACNHPISQSQSMQETSQFHLFFVKNSCVTFLIFEMFITGDWQIPAYSQLPV